MSKRKNINVLVTGATDGIGLAITKLYLEKGGYSVYGVGRNRASLNRLKKKYGKSFFPMRVDLLLSDDLNRLLGEIRTLAIDILINNAGINRIAPVEETKDLNWNEIIELNLTVPMKLTRAVVSSMKKKKFGRIVNISSIFGTVSFPKRSVYSSSKGGLNGLTRGSALDLAPYGILVNSVSPGFTHTKLTETTLGEKGIKKLVSEVPLKRMAKTQEIAKLVHFFGSQENSYVTGQDIIADGGYTVK